LASCLPLLLQIPVFISLFYMLRTDLKKHICGPQLVEHYNAVNHKMLTSVSQLPSKYVEQTACNQVAPHSAKFLFIPDITAKATGFALIALIALYISSQVVSTLMATATADPTQRRLVLFLPIVFVIILYRYPAGLLVYWITTNVWTIGQQFLIRRHMGPPPKVQAAGASNGKAAGGIFKPLLAGSGAGGGSSGEGASDGGDGGQKAGQKAEQKAGQKAPARPTAAPPRAPRKKKKRSGRRR
jgi:YidC/Oxa1 family membrane protein insertase